MKEYRNRTFTALSIALAVTIVLAPSVWAGGISLYEIATPDVGLASAGYAARANDASTVFKNPAGMNQLNGAQLQGGLQALYGSVSFSPDANTSFRLGPDAGDNAVGWLPGGSLFVTLPLNEKWSVGFGSLSYFGLAEDYGNHWVGRYYVQKSALLGMSLMPAVSFKATDWLAIGAGLNAMYGYLDNDRRRRPDDVAGWRVGFRRQRGCADQARRKNARRRHVSFSGGFGFPGHTVIYWPRPGARRDPGQSRQTRSGHDGATVGDG
jgi:long-subunit fatty acid transport protein